MEFVRPSINRCCRTRTSVSACSSKWARTDGRTDGQTIDTKRIIVNYFFINNYAAQGERGELDYCFIFIVKVACELCTSYQNYAWMTNSLLHNLSQVIYWRLIPCLVGVINKAIFHSFEKQQHAEMLTITFRNRVLLSFFFILLTSFSPHGSFC